MFIYYFFILLQGLPRHGGAGIGERHANGLLNGWDGNPQTLTQFQFTDSWSDPFQGRPVPQIPFGFTGDVGGLFGAAGLTPMVPRMPGFWCKLQILEYVIHFILNINSII